MSMVLDGLAPRTRTTDPTTSVDAGRNANVRKSQREVLNILRQHGALPDYLLTAHAIAYGTSFSESRLRSARAELVEQGKVHALPQLGTTPRGRSCQVWALT